MKKVFTLLSIMLLAGSLSAQYYYLPFVNAGQNPSGLNTDEDQTAAYMLANYAGYTQVQASGDADWSAAQTIPFSFTFNGTAYTSVYIAPTGVVSFTATTGTAPVAPIASPFSLPNASIPDNSICAWGINLTGANDGVIVKTHGTAPNRQFWITWASASWSQGGGWVYWSVVLEETTNTVYIIDARNYVASGTGVRLTAGLQFDASTAMNINGNGALFATNETSGGSDVGPLDNSYYAFILGTQPDYDGAMANLTAPSYLKIATGGYDVEATITNLGAQTITDLELTYTIDGANPVVANLTGLNIASGASANVVHPTNWNPTTEGNFAIEYWASKINGNSDANPGDDKTDASVITYTNSYDRTVLYETFTSSTCPPCVAGNINFEGVIAGLPAAEVASIKYQMSWPGDGDPYNTADGNVRRGYYSVNAVPNLQADGGWDGNSASFTATVHSDALQVPAFVEIVAEYEVVVDSQKVRTCATVNAMQDLGAATLQIAIIEGTTYDNVGTNGETEFFHVVKKMVADANGGAITITNGMNEKVCMDYYFQGSYRLPNNSGDLINDATEHSVEEFTDLQVVVWVQNDATHAVYNSANATEGITPSSVNGISNLDANVTVFPNPAIATTTVSIASTEAAVATVKVMDLVGKTVINMSNVQINTGSTNVVLNTASLNAGVYMIEITMNGETSSQQLVIQK